MPGYGLLPASEGSGLLPWSHVERRMESARNYWIVTASLEGEPHVAPVWGVWDDSTFYFATGEVSKKARNLNENPRLVVHLESGDDVVILQGSGERIHQPDHLRALDSLYEDKYSIRLGESPIFLLRIETAFAWNEADFPGSATRWQFSNVEGDEA